MATAKRRTKKRSAKKSTKKSRAITKAGKVKVHAKAASIAKALNRLESRVDLLEKNDAATYTLLLGMANSSRKHHGHKPIKSLPGFVKPRLYGGGYGMGAATKALGSGK
jgi:hypothetical protein